MKILYRMKYGLLLAMLVLAANSVFGQIQLSFSFTSPTCYGYTDGTATVTATGGAEPYAYLWNNGQAGQTNYGLGASTVSVTVTDQNGQTASGSVTVTQPDPLNVTITALGFSCYSNNGTLTANPSGGTPSYVYAWSGGQTTQTISVSTPGTYYLTVTDANSCSKVATYNVAQAAEIVPAYVFNMPSCFGDSNGSIGITVYGTNPPFTWTWSNGVQNLPLTNVAAGDYGISITDASGCTLIDTVTLMSPPQMIVEVFATNSICYSLPNGGNVYAAVAGGFSPYTFVWSNGSNQQGQLGLPPGYYSVTVYDQHGCTATDGDSLTLPPPLTGEVVTISPACGGNNGCITVTGVGGTPPYTYMWPALGVSGPTVCGLGPGSYYVCIFDANGCQHDFTVDLDSIDGLDVTLILTKAECPGVDNGTATAIVSPPGGAYNYQWLPQPNPSVPQINSLPAGTVVSVTVTDANTGCMGTATGTILAHNQVKVNVTDTDVTCVGDQTGSATAVATGGTNPYNYVWTLPDSSTVNGPSISGLGVGAYTVSVTDVKGCTAIGVADIGALSNPKASFKYLVTECDSDGITVQISDNSTDLTDTIVSWNWNISWSGGSTTSTQQNPPALLFQVDDVVNVQLTVTSSKGCTAVISTPFTVTGVPTFSLNVPNPAVDCENDSIFIEVTGSPSNTYTWMPTTGLIFNPDAQHVIANPTQTTDYQLIVANGLCADTADLKVVRVQPINLMVQDTSIVTCDTLAPLSATANAAANTTIVWYDINGDTVAAGGQVIVPAGGQDTFTVVATDPYGCSETGEVAVTGNSVDVNVSFNAATPGCENISLPMSVTNLDPTDILTYQWSSSDTNLVISPTNTANVTATGPAGTYTVTVVVKNQHDCERTFTTQLTLDSTTSLVNAISADLCKGLTVDFLNNSGVSGTWHFGDGDSSTLANPSHIYAQAGNYVVSFVSTENCVLPYDTTIAVLPDVAVKALATSEYENCLDTAQIQFNGSAVAFNPIASWNWAFSTTPPQTSNQQNPLITFSEEGSFTATLIVTDTNGCTGSVTLPVTIDIVEDLLNDEEEFCPGNSAFLNPNYDPNLNYNYNWISVPNDPNFDPNAPNPSVMPAVSTLYTATIVNGLCTVIDSVLVTPLTAATVDLTGDTLVCSDEPFTLTAQNTNGVTFVWSESPDFTPSFDTLISTTIIPKKNGVYYVKAINADGCEAVDSVKVNNVQVDIDAEPANQNICLGDSTELTVTNLDAEDTLTYEWTPALPPIPNPVVSPTTPTTYVVKTTNQYGCQDTMHFNVNVISLSVTAENVGKDTLFPGQSTDLLATVTSNATNINYSWTPPNSLNNPNIPNPTASPSETTVYTVTASAGGLCPDTASVTVFFRSPDCAEPFIFVPTAFTPNYDGNNDFFIVRGPDIKEVYFAVWDRWGEKVYETKDPAAKGWDGTYGGKELLPDSYAWYVQVTCGNGDIFKKKGNVTLLK